MRSLRSGLIVASFLFVQTIFAQKFEVPAVELKVKEDYAKVEKDVIAGTKWLFSLPVNEQVAKRKEVSAFIMNWIIGSPTVNVGLNAYISELSEKNPVFLILFMSSSARYSLENNYSNDVHAQQTAALRDVIKYYKAGNGMVKDKKLDKLVKAEESGKLDEWIEKNLKM